MTNERQLADLFLKKRDEESFLQLYRLITPSLYPLAVHILGNAQDAEETVQETWIRAIRSLPAFRWDAKLRTWITSILIRCCAERRKNAEPTFSGFQEEPVNDRTPNDPGLRMDLQQAIATLSDKQRTVLLLHDLEGYTHEEIGSLLGIEPGTSKSQLSRARRSLRSYMTGGNES